MAIFDDLFGENNQNPADYEDSYIQQIVPPEAMDLWEVTISHSPVWDSYSPEDHMFLADLYANAVVAGSLDEAEDFLDYLEVEWDDYDIADFYEAYDSIANG